MATTEVASTATQSDKLSGFADVLHPERVGSNHRTEFIAGLTTFVTMAYIIAVNPSIMVGTTGAPTGLDPTALIIGTILAAVIPTLVMGLWADKPWALAPGLGYNALFAYTVVGAKHFPVGAALALVFLDGLAFLLIVSGPWREGIIKGIPTPIKFAAGAGIGLFIAFIGFVNSGIVSLPTAAGGLPALGSLNNASVVVALVGVVITGLLMARKVRGALLYGIIATTAIAWGSSIIRPSTRGALLPFNPTNPSKLSDFVAAPDFGRFMSKGVGRIDFGSLFGGHGFAMSAVLLFFLTFLVTDMMDSLGTFSGLASKLGILREDGNFPGSGKALMVDAAAGMWGPVTGNATIATFIESAAGVGEGGKTGLTAVWVAAFFALSLFLVPFVNLIPTVATAPALIVVGYLMIEPVVKIGFQDVTDGLPAFLTIITMPVTYSIADGMFVGIVSYVVLKTATGRAREVSWVMWIFAALLLLAKILDATNS